MLHQSTPNTSITTLLLLFEYEVETNVQTISFSMINLDCLQLIKCALMIVFIF
jgi:hypothetical protein